MTYSCTRGGSGDTATYLARVTRDRGEANRLWPFLPCYASAPCILRWRVACRMSRMPQDIRAVQGLGLTFKSFGKGSIHLHICVSVCLCVCVSVRLCVWVLGTSRTDERWDGLRFEFRSWLGHRGQMRGGQKEGCASPVKLRSRAKF